MVVKFIWKIENFSHMKAGTIRSSPESVFLVITINPFGPSECISIEVRRCFQDNYYYSNLSISLLDSEGSPLVWREMKNSPLRSLIQFPDIKREPIFGSMRNKFLPNDTLTLQCLEWETREELIRPPVFPLFSCSRIELHSEVIEKTFCWKIRNKSALEPHQISKQLELFRSEGDAKLSTSAGYVLTIGLFIDTSLGAKLSLSLDRAHVKCIISVLDVKGKIIQFSDEEYNFQEEDKVWTIDIPITRDMLEYYRNDFLPNYTLSLVFACTFSTSEINHLQTYNYIPLTSASTTSSNEPENQQQSLPNKTISQALMGILKEGFMSDFSFRVQNKTFPVHKNILSARSSVFRAMFTAGMKEKDSSSVGIPDVEADTFQRMLDFIYSDTFEDDMQWESASKLNSVADKYDLEPLKQKCSRLLKTGLSVSSVLDVLLLGDAHQDDDLKAAALDFVARNDKEIVGSERWRRFAEENVQFAFDTLQKLYEKKMDA